MSNVFVNGVRVSGSVRDRNDLRRQLCCPDDVIDFQESAAEDESHSVFRVQLTAYSLKYRRPDGELWHVAKISNVTILPILKDPVVRKDLVTVFGLLDKFFDEPYVEIVERDGIFALGCMSQL